MRSMRKILGWLFGGALGGVGVASYAVWRLLPWYNEPGQGVTTSIVDTKAQTKAVIASVFHWQLIGAAIGAAIGIVIAILLIARASKRAKLAPPAATPPTGASRPG
jgi:choline-glycine betaine transporter